MSSAWQRSRSGRWGAYYIRSSFSQLLCERCSEGAAFEAHLSCTARHGDHANGAPDAPQHLQRLGGDLELACVRGVPDQLQGSPRLDRKAGFRWRLRGFLLPFVAEEKRHAVQFFSDLDQRPKLLQ